MHTQGALTGHEDPSSIIVLVEGGQLLLYDLTATTGQPAAPQGPGLATEQQGALAEQRSGSPSKLRPAAGLQQQPQQHARVQQQVAPPPPPVQQLFKGQLQGQPLVTAARLRMIPIQPVPLRGLQVRCTSCAVDEGLLAEPAAWQHTTVLQAYWQHSHASTLYCP